MSNWVETYRGGVMPRDCDNMEHLTIASYVERMGDAYLGFLDSVGLGENYRAEERKGFAAVESHTRFKQELRAGDVLHIEGALLDIEGKIMTSAQRVVNSVTGEVTAVVHYKTVHLDLDKRKAVVFSPERRAELLKDAAQWDGPEIEKRSFPEGLEGFIPTFRDTVKSWEMDVIGHLSAHFYVERFSQATMQTMAAIGITPDYARENQRGGSTFEMNLFYFSELNAGDTVAIHTAITDVGNSSFRILHKMVNQRTGKLCAALGQFGVFFDLETRRPVTLPDDIRAGINELLVETNTNEQLD